MSIEYEQIADRVDAIMLELLDAHGSGDQLVATGADAKGMQTELNARIRAEFPEITIGGVLISVVSPVPSQNILLRMLFRLIHNGISEGMWTADYLGTGHYQRHERGYRAVERVGEEE